jgi:hypothetical protein
MNEQQRVNKAIEETKDDLATFSNYEVKVLIETICKGVVRDSPNFNVKMLMLRIAMDEYIKRQG